MSATEEEVNAFREVIAATPAVLFIPRRMSLPTDLPRTDFHHEPASTMCGCGCGCALKVSAYQTDP